MATRRNAILSVLAVGVIVAAPARAYQFTLASDGTQQQLSTYWEAAYPALSCRISISPCLYQPSANSKVAGGYNSSTGVAPQTLTTSTYGSLNWDGRGRLWVQTFLNPQARAFTFQPTINGWAEGWASIDGNYPMTFVMNAEAGDPGTTNLQITPRLTGTVEHFSAPGGLTRLEVQFEMAVDVNGVRVSSDLLHDSWEFANGATGTTTLAFPKGTANDALVVSAPVGSVISITTWTYARAFSSINGVPFSEGKTSVPFGANPQVNITIQPVPTVAVGDAQAPGRLALRASPNPAVAGTRIEYDLPRASDVRVAVYDVAGKRVATLVDRTETAGSHGFAWDGGSESGSFPAGMYLIELLAGRERIVKRLALLGQ